MKWTRDLPAVDGYYWHRYHGGDSPTVVYVEKETGGWYCRDEARCDYLSEWGGEWLGPIRPEETDEEWSYAPEDEGWIFLEVGGTVTYPPIRRQGR